jgi:YVTN family beta-propeller protein
MKVFVREAVCLAFFLGMAFSNAAPFAYVPGNSGGSISVIDVETNNVIDTIPNIANPWAVAIDPLGAKGYVRGNGIYALDLLRNRVIGTPNLSYPGRAPMALSPRADRLYVALGGSSGSSTLCALSTIDLSQIGCTTTPASLPFGLAVSPNGQTVYLTHQAVANPAPQTGSVSVFSTGPMAYSVTIQVGIDPWGIAVDQSAQRVYVANLGSASVSVIDASSNSVIDTVAVGNNPISVVANPKAKRVYVANAVSGTVSVIDTDTNVVIDTIATGTGSRNLSITPNGDRLYVTRSSPASTVVAVDTATNSIVNAGISVSADPVAEGQFIGGGQLLDVDGDGRVLATTDLLLLMRWNLGFRGTELVNGIAPVSGARRQTAAQLEEYLRGLGTLGAVR